MEIIKSSKNESVVEQIEQFRKEVLTKSIQKEIVEIFIDDIQIFDKKITFKGAPFVDAGLNKILKFLCIRKDFSDYEKQLEPADWEYLIAKIKDAKQEFPIFGEYEANGDETGICDIYFDKEKIVKRTFDYNNFFDVIKTSVRNSKSVLDLKSKSFNPNKQSANLTFLNRDGDIDVLGNGNDIWKFGSDVNFNLYGLTAAPFFERLICENGMISKQFMEKSIIASKKFDVDRMENSIIKTLDSDTSHQLIKENVQKLNGCTVSIAEYMEARNFINKVNVDSKYDGLLATHFPTEKFYKAYGVDIEKQDKLWKATAATDINAYDFFNTLTWVASHRDKSGLDLKDVRALQMKAGDILFKPLMDMQLVAPKITFN